MKNKTILWIAVGIALFLILIFVVRSFWNPEEREAKAGVAWLKKLESKDMDETEGKVKKAKKEAQAEAIANGELSLWAQFSDYAIFGDSRTVGFYFYEFLDKQRVLADNGLTIQDIDTYLPQMKTLNPSCLFLCTGLNDVIVGRWKTPEEYVAAYEEKIQMLKKELPDTQIIINSIFPAQDPTFERSSAWKNIPEYNEAVKVWCEEKGYSYIDNTDVFEEHKDLYDVDGIHFKKDFYQYWAVNMLGEVDL